jgi:hypothetical protein
MPLINSLEDGNFCKQIFNSSDQMENEVITEKKCETSLGGISKTGLTNIFQYAYKIA